MTLPKAAVAAIEYHLPELAVTNDALAREFEAWPADRIKSKTGIEVRRVAAADECASDLAVAAAERLFASGVCAREDIDYVLLCTQSPDYFLPTTACLLQARLGLRQDIGALDFNLGCSGFVYGLGLAKGLVETGQARSVLLLTAETYSKFMHAGDKSVRTLFGDAAAATLIRSVAQSEECIGPFANGTDGSGGQNLIVPTGGVRKAIVEGAAEETDRSGNVRTINSLYMNGAEIFNFTLRAVPECIARLTASAGCSLDEVDVFVFHQANAFMLDHLRRKLAVPESKFVVEMSDCGNTVSSTIPIALKRAARRGTILRGHRVMVVGFGVGYSWSAALLRWM